MLRILIVDYTEANRSWILQLCRHWWYRKLSLRQHTDNQWRQSCKIDDLFVFSVNINVQCLLDVISRVEADQEALWKYSLDLLKDYVTEETLHGLEVAAS